MLLVNGLASLAAMAVLAGLLTWQFVEVREQADSVNQALHLRRQGNLVSAYCARLEASQRHYLLTGRPEGLATYREIRQALEPALTQLETQSASQPAQQARVRSVRQLLARWERAADAEVRVRQQTPIRVTGVMATEETEATMEAIRREIDAFRQIEIDQEAVREARLAESSSVAFAVAASTIALVGGSFAGFGVRQVRDVARAYHDNLMLIEDQKERLQAQNEELESINAELTESYETLSQQNEELETQQDEIRTLYDRLVELDRLKTNFVSAVTHELRTPLTSIVGYAEFLEDRLAGPLNEAQADHVEQIQHAAGRLQYLVDDLLDFARLDAGTFKLDVSTLDVREPVQRALESLQPQARERGVTLSAELPGEPLTALADAKRLEQVLVNLVGNAIKFTPLGGSVTVKAHASGGTIRCEVVDTGIGITPEDQARLFQRFVQLDAGNTRRSGGTGLGLSIAKALVEAHGGEIGVTSNSGHGSTFWFALPGGAA